MGKVKQKERAEEMTDGTQTELDAMKQEIKSLYKIAGYVEATGNFEDAEALSRTADELSARIGAVELSLAPAVEETPGYIAEPIAA
jgi:hypothetical protein